MILLLASIRLQNTFCKIRQYISIFIEIHFNNCKIIWVEVIFLLGNNFSKAFRKNYEKSKCS